MSTYLTRMPILSLGWGKKSVGDPLFIVFRVNTRKKRRMEHTEAVYGKIYSLI